MRQLLKNNDTNESVSQYQSLTTKYARARHNILLVVVFTVINIVLLVTNSNTYFLFSAYIPYVMADLGMFFSGMYPSEVYGDDFAGMMFMGKEFLVITLVIAAVILILYLLSWIFSNKQRVGWMISALVFFCIDTVAMLLLTGIALESIIDIIFHGWVIVSLSTGISAHYKLKKFPEEKMVDEVPIEYVDTEEPGRYNDRATDE